MGVSGHLATVTSVEENSFLVKNFLNGESGKGFWLGGYQLPNQAETNEGWQWVTGEAWNYTNWWPDNVVPEPNDWPGMGVENNEENYMGFSHESFGHWNDTKDDETRVDGGYFVEVDLCKAKSLDIDGNGTFDALTDGILILRYGFGYAGESLVKGAVTPDCVRCTPERIQSYLQQVLP